MMRTIRVILLVSLFFSMVAETETFSGSIVDTKHNLSVSGPGPVKSASEDEICIFCHAPDRSKGMASFLWNRTSSKVVYIPYESSTLYAKIGQPTGSSKLCLSCHDGTIALGALLSESQEVQFAAGIRFIPEGPSRLGTDLSDDHPVSFVYDSSLAISSGELADPSMLPKEVSLDRDRQMQCTTCHDPHDNEYGKFLVMPNNYSYLCTTCHQKEGWQYSAHSTSGAAWNGAAPDPWTHTAYTTVSENGCENCHKPHAAGGHERLLNYSFEEDNCLVCHNGHVADTDIEKELAKPYIHAVQNYTGVHDPSEDFSLFDVQKHVECADCHNAHWSYDAPSPGAPQVSGALSGVKGIDMSGKTVPVAGNEYEICFKCHADSTFITSESVTRNIFQLNTRLEFDPSNPSYHPVITKGANTNVPSLYPSYTTASVIFCTDCHNNDDTRGLRGPHGSRNRHLLELNYSTLDFTQESPSNYALCYKCHQRQSILNDESFPYHKKHIVEENTPCSACHDPHGISATQGDSISNSHLINFDITIVQPDSQGRIQFEDSGTFSGRCFLSCHGSSHEPGEYPLSR